MRATMSDPRASPSEGRYNDGLDDAFARPSAQRVTPAQVTAAQATAARATAVRSQRAAPQTVRREMKSADEIVAEGLGATVPSRLSRRLNLTSAPVIAGIVFGVLSLIVSASMLQTLERFALAGSVPLSVLVAVPALFSVLFAVLFFRGHLSGGWLTALGRGLAVGLATWPAFSVLAGSIWCGPAFEATCFGGMLLVSGVVGGGPMLLASLIGGVVMAWLLRRNTFI
jgi:hypothetical protein